MINKLSLLLSIAVAAAFAQVQGFTPVTQQMLENPSPDDWLMYSRTYDAQRYSPLKQITKQNVSQLRMVWTRGIGAGQTETIPLVHKGVMYVVAPGAIVQALDGATGDLLWEYKRKVPANVAGSGAHQVARHLSGHRSLHRARQLCRRPRRPHRRAALGNEDRRARPHLRPHRRRRQGDHRSRVRRQTRELLHRRARRADRQRSLALLHDARARRAGR